LIEDKTNSAFSSAQAQSSPAGKTSSERRSRANKRQISQLLSTKMLKFTDDGSKVFLSSLKERDDNPHCIKGDGLYSRTRETIADAIEKPVEKVNSRHHPKRKRRAKAVISTV
jgi:hypothetical protein